MKAEDAIAVTTVVVVVVVTLVEVDAIVDVLQDARMDAMLTVMVPAMESAIQLVQGSATEVVQEIAGVLVMVGVVGIAVQAAKGAVVQHVPAPVEPLVQAAA